MKKVLILYFSGAGAAKKIALTIHDNLKGKCTTALCSFENAQHINMNDFDAFVIGTPVYHAAPAAVIMDFFAGTKPLAESKPAFLYNTRATWSCSTNRILAKQLKRCSILTIMDRDYRSPASDGSLIVPFIQRFWEFDKQINDKIQLDCDKFVSIINSATPQSKGYIPRFRMSSIINAPNKLAGQLYTFKIYIHQDKCIKCGKCIANCPHKALIKDAHSFPAFKPKNCENCYRCIHHCPAKALSLSRRRTPKKLLVYEDSQW